EVFRLYDAKTGKALSEIKPEDRVGHPVFSPNGRLVAWADRANAVHLHDAVTQKVVRSLRSSVPLPKGECDNAGLAFSPDGEHLIVTTCFQDITLPTPVFPVSTARA